MIEKIATQQDGKPSGVRESILAAAAELFAIRGYTATSVREVVEAAGCRKPTLYYYFENKEELYRQVVETSCTRITDTVNSAMAPAGTVRERMRRGLCAYLGLVREQPTTLKLLMAAERQPEAGQPRFDFDAFRLGTVEMIRLMLQRGVQTGELRQNLNVEEAALCLFGMVDYRLVLFLHGTPIPDDYPERLLDLFFNGVGSCLTR